MGVREQFLFSRNCLSFISVMGEELALESLELSGDGRAFSLLFALARDRNLITENTAGSRHISYRRFRSPFSNHLRSEKDGRR